MSDQEIVISHTAMLGASEIGVGSVLHAFRVPFRGFFLSLNQCAILNLAVLTSDVKCLNRLPFQISLAAAILKIMNPFGNSITPSIAITVQGALFSLGIKVAGSGKLGRILGSVLLSLWGWFQGLFMLFVVLGSTFFEMLHFYSDWISVPSLLVVWIGGRVFSTCLVSLIVGRLSEDHIRRYRDYFHRITLKMNPSSSKKSAWRRVWRKMTRWPVLIFFVLIGIFFYCTDSDSSSAALSWFRTVGWMFLVSLALASIPPRWIEKLLKKLGAHESLSVIAQLRQNH